MTTRTQRYHQAAVTYFVYGLVYLIGGIYLAQLDVVARSGWIWFVVGTLFLVVLPPLIWREFKWVTRILAILVFVRVIGLVRTIVNVEGETVPLPGGHAFPMRYGAVAFLLIAVLTGAMLVRAGWNIRAKKEAAVKE